MTRNQQKDPNFGIKNDLIWAGKQNPCHVIGITVKLDMESSIKCSSLDVRTFFRSFAVNSAWQLQLPPWRDLNLMHFSAFWKIDPRERKMNGGVACLKRSKLLRFALQICQKWRRQDHVANYLFSHKSLDWVDNGWILPLFCRCKFLFNCFTLSSNIVPMAIIHVIVYRVEAF